MSGEGMIAAAPSQPRRDFDAVRADQRDADAVFLERYAARLEAGPPRREKFEHPVNTVQLDREARRQQAILLRGLASSIRAGLGDPEPGWPIAKGSSDVDSLQIGAAFEPAAFRRQCA